MAVRDDVLAFVAANWAEPEATGPEEVVQRLIAQGYSRLKGELLEAFVNLAFGRAWIKWLAADPPIGLSDTALIWCEGSPFRELRLADVPEFTEAFAVAEEALSKGTIPWDQFRLCCGSAKVDCINQLFESGRPLGGGTMSPPVLMRLWDAPGFEEWYQGLRPKPGDSMNRAKPWWRFWR